MMIRGLYSDFFFETMLPALRAKVFAEFKAKPRLYNKLLNVISTQRSIEQFSQMTGVGLFAEIAEGADVGTDSMLQGFDKTFKPTKFGLGLACSQELVEDDKIGLAGRRAVALANSANQTIEIQGASVFNNAFATVGPDGKVLCASDHPLVKAGGVQSNILSVAADLDVTSLELALTDWELIKTAEGFYQTCPTPNLLVASANRWQAFQVVKAGQKSETANGVVNAFDNGGENGRAVNGPIVWAFLTDPDAWFLTAPPEQTGLVWLWRKQPFTTSDFIEKNQTGYMYMWYRATCGFYDWRGVYGTPGA